MIKIQSDYKAEIAEYKTQISVLKDKLKTYDLMEDELDNFINQSPGDGVGSDQEVVDIIKEIPNSNKRRINQCLKLKC